MHHKSSASELQQLLPLNFILGGKESPVCNVSYGPPDRIIPKRPRPFYSRAFPEIEAIPQFKEALVSSELGYSFIE